MKFMLITNSLRHGYAEYAKWPLKIREAQGAYMHKLNQKLQQNGELVLAAGLASPEQAKLVRADANCKPITDGVFPESKEYLAGWWIVDVESEQRALEIAAEASAGPYGHCTDLDGKTIERYWIEVRQVMGSSADIT
ncbi:MAG TPA: YciI family protein [Gemmatimonadales bacterium]|nr:YciI family protein [Gemmatimonadales bacterium]